MKLFIFEYTGELCYGGVSVIARDEDEARCLIQADHASGLIHEGHTFDSVECPDFAERVPRDFCFFKVFEIEVYPQEHARIISCSYMDREEEKKNADEET
jgi:hypothetical protein